jgi:predicted amidohydrolase
MQDIHITIIQSDLVWENQSENLIRFQEKIDKIKEITDVIVLPEMFTTGFAVDRTQLAEEEEGEGLNWMKQMAKKKNAAVVGSIAVKIKEHLLNRLYWVNPDGNFYSYDKRHLFRMAGENNFFNAGSNKLIVEYKGWKFCPLICYDLRFPVWSRNTWKTESENYQADYDVLLYVANWPEVRSYPWKQLLIARAIENQSYVVGVNRVGKDGNQISHSGDSAVINPRGEIISTLLPHEEKSETVLLTRSYLTDFQKVFPVGLDADKFNLQ